MCPVVKVQFAGLSRLSSVFPLCRLVPGLFTRRVNSGGQESNLACVTRPPERANTTKQKPCRCG